MLAFKWWLLILCNVANPLPNVSNRSLELNHTLNATILPRNFSNVLLNTTTTPASQSTKEPPKRASNLRQKASIIVLVGLLPSFIMFTVCMRFVPEFCCKLVQKTCG